MRIPLALVTGFLGSGKTTFLRRIIHTHQDQRIVYLVNEFSPVDVDGHVLEGDTQSLVALPGGSIFCQCLATEFISTLKAIPEHFGTQAAPIDGVVIEASGVANPMVIEQMLEETKLDQVYALSSVVSIVDPGTFPLLLESLPNIRAQVAASDVVIINKTDLFSEAQIDSTEREVRDINPAAKIHRAVQCAVDIDLFPARAARKLRGEYAPCADPNYMRLSVRLTEPQDVERLRATLDDIGAGIYRVKGFVPASDGPCYFDYSASGVTVHPVESAPDECRLAFIVSPFAYEPAKRLIEDIKRGWFAKR